MGRRLQAMASNPALIEWSRRIVPRRAGSLLPAALNIYADTPSFNSAFNNYAAGIGPTPCPTTGKFPSSSSALDSVLTPATFLADGIDCYISCTQALNPRSLGSSNLKQSAISRPGLCAMPHIPESPPQSKNRAVSPGVNRRFHDPEEEGARYET
jgi:hypothetical protein